MSKKTKRKPAAPGEDLRLNPEKRTANKFDADSIALFPVAQPGSMGMRVRDNCAEEHIM